MSGGGSLSRAAMNADLPGIVRPPEGTRPPRPPRRASVRLPALVASEDANDAEAGPPTVAQQQPPPSLPLRAHPDAIAGDEELERLIYEGFQAITRMPRRIELVDLQPKTYHAVSALEPEPEPEPESNLEQKLDRHVEDQRLKRALDALAEAQKKAAELTKVQEKLDKIEIKTLSGKVRTIDKSLLGNSSTELPAATKLLFLTSRQAEDFDFQESFSTLLHELDIPTPGLVINVLPSEGGLSLNNVQFMQSKFDLKRYSELDTQSLLATDRRMKTFVTECVLQVAIDNNALILINDTSCALSRAFAEVLGKYSSTVQGKLPFTLLHIGMVTDACRDPACFAYSLRSHIPACWEKSAARSAKIKKQDGFRYGTKRREPGSAHCYQFDGGPDIIPGANAYIMIETLDSDGNETNVAWESFVSKFVQQQVKYGWPNITFGTGNCDIQAAGHAFVDRGLPLMFLDSRLPPGHQAVFSAGSQPSSDTERGADGYATTFEDAQQDLESLEYELIRRGGTNWYNVSTFGHLHAVYNHVIRREEASKAASSRMKDPKMILDAKSQKGKFIGEVIVLHERAAASTNDQDHVALHPSDTHDPANEATKLYRNLWVLRKKIYNRWALLLLKEVWMYKLDEIEQDDISGLSDWLMQRSLDCRLYCPNMEGSGLLDTPLPNLIPTLMKLYGPGTNQPYFVEKLGHAENCLGLPGTRKLSVVVLCVDTDVVQPSMLSTVLQATRQVLEQMQTHLEQVISQNDLSPVELLCDDQPALRKLITDPKLYHGNLNNVQALKETIQQIATSSRLPDRNSEQAVRILKQVWDAVDIFSAEANYSKQITKTSYITLLLIGMTITLVTVSSLNSPQMVQIDGADYCPDGLGNYTQCPEDEWWHFDDDARSNIVVTLSLTMSLLGSITAYLDPQQKWTVLRGAALELTSEVWKFRLRTGPYAMVNGSSKHAEQYLQQYLASIKEHVQKSASVSESNFYGKFEIFGGAPQKVEGSDSRSQVITRAPRSLGIYTHGQYPNESGKYEGQQISGTFGHANPVGLEGMHDDHHSPCSCEEYLTLRVEPQLAFYKRRIPGYYRRRTVFHSLLLLGALSGTLLAFLNLDEWTAAVTAASGVMTAWVAFTDVTRKMRRYSNCVDKAGILVLAWKSLTSVEQARADRQRDLFAGCEELFERERDAWLSTSAHKKTLQQNGQEDGEKTAQKRGQQPLSSAPA